MRLAGCSKRPPGKAAASEEARRYAPHFVGPFALAIGLGERKSPSSDSDFRGTLVELLSDARTKLAGFFSILLRPLELFEHKLLGQHHWNDDPDGVAPLDGRWLCEL